MTDPIDLSAATPPPDFEFAFGAIQSPPDPNDYPIADLYALAAAPEVAAPAALTVPGPFPAVLNQGRLPQCVAYSDKWFKQWQDYRDQGSVWYNFDSGAFFAQIGGGPNGAVTRVSLSSLQKTGYPLPGGLAALHVIDSYYAVPVTKADITAAFASFPTKGPMVAALPWFYSWLSPGSTGILPAPSGGVVGGHQVALTGYDGVGLIGPNSWGPAWGRGGYFTIPWASVPYIWEVWRTVDKIELPPPPAKYAIKIAAHAVVHIANVDNQLRPTKIMSWTDYPWGPKASAAPCGAPRRLPGQYSGSAVVVPVLGGPSSVFRGKYVRVGAGAPGVTLATT